MNKIKVTRVEQHIIRKTNPIWKTIDDYCLRSKNLYNETNYIIRQQFIKTGKWDKFYDLCKSIKFLDCYKNIGSNVGQSTIKMVCEVWKSFAVASKDYNNNPSKYLGRPNLPKYKDKENGRYVLALDSNKVKLRDGYVHFCWKPFKNYIISTQLKNVRLIQLRFIPNKSHYTAEIVYEINVIDQKESSNKICGIDIGVDNLATVVNNTGLKSFVINGKVIKSYNQYYNKKLAKYESILKKTNNKNWSNRLQRLTEKRFYKIKDYMHKASKYIVSWCVNNDIDTIVIGNNIKWKQNSNMGNTMNQTFVQIPYKMLIDQIVYKAENNGIKTIITEESYTSGTSFIDDEEPTKTNYNNKRRIHRGLFKSNTGVFINADINGAYQIIKKVFPKAFADGIQGVSLHPVRVLL